MVEALSEFKRVFGDIELSNVGLGEFPAKPEVENLWADCGIKAK